MQASGFIARLTVEGGCLKINGAIQGEVVIGLDDGDYVVHCRDGGGKHDREIVICDARDYRG